MVYLNADCIIINFDTFFIASVASSKLLTFIYKLISESSSLSAFMTPDMYIDDIVKQIILTLLDNVWVTGEVCSKLIQKLFC